METKTNAISLWAELLQIFWTFLVKKIIPQFPNEELIESKIQKEEYHVFLLYCGVSYLLFGLTFLFGESNIGEFLYIYVISTIILLLLKKGKLQLIKYLYCGFICFYQILSIFNQNLREEFLPFFSIQSIFILSCIILTKSIKLTLTTLVSNIIVNELMLKPRLHEIFNISNYHNLEIETMKSILFQSILVVVVKLILKSRTKLMTEIQQQIKEKYNIEQDSVKFNNEMQQLKEEKQDLFLNISYDILNYLNFILENSKRAILINVVSEIKKNIENIILGADLIKSFIQNMIDFKRIETAQLQIKSVFLETSGLLQKIWGISHILIQTNHLSGSLYISKNMPDELEIDDSRLTQILYNLLSNAVKFTKRGFVVVVLSWLTNENLTYDMTLPTLEDYFRQSMIQNTKLSINSPKNMVFSPKNMMLSPKKVSFELDSFSKYLEFDASNRNPYINTVKQYSMEKNIRTRTYVDLMEKYQKFSFTESQSKKVFENFIASNAFHRKNDAENEPEEVLKIGFLKMEIIDSGSSISQEELNLYFRSFSEDGIELESKNKQKLGGISISQIICRKMGGKLEGYSIKNTGSVFVALMKSKGVNH